MSIRRFFALALLALALGAALPGIAEAGIARDATLGGDGVIQPDGFLTWLSQWTSDLVANVEHAFTAIIGATMGSGG